jgi:hypothetical protein
MMRGGEGSGGEGRTARGGELCSQEAQEDGASGR